MSRVYAYIALFKDYERGDAALSSLFEAGITLNHIGFLSRNSEAIDKVTRRTMVTEDPDAQLAEKTAGGAMIGGLAGMLAGAATLVVPGLGAMLAVGAVGGALAGTGLGAAIGSMVGASEYKEKGEDPSSIIVDSLEKGDIALVVSVPTSKKPTVDGVFAVHKPKELIVRRFGNKDDVNPEEILTWIDAKPVSPDSLPRQQSAAANAAHDVGKRAVRPSERKRMRDAHIDDAPGAGWYA